MVQEVNLVAILTFVQEVLVVNQEVCNPEVCNQEVNPAAILTFAQEAPEVNQEVCQLEDSLEAIQMCAQEAQVPVETRVTYSAIL